MPDVPPKAYEAAARAYSAAGDSTAEWEAVEAVATLNEPWLRAIVDAVWPPAYAAGVTEGRRQAVEAIRAFADEIESSIARDLNAIPDMPRDSVVARLGAHQERHRSTGERSQPSPHPLVLRGLYTIPGLDGVWRFMSTGVHGLNPRGSCELGMNRINPEDTP